MAKEVVLKKRGKLNFFNPRQESFLANYFDPKSKTFSNIRQSAIQAGYDAKYAENLMSNAPEWLVSRIEESGDATMLQQAITNLGEVLKKPTRIPAMGAFGPVYEKIKNKKGKVIKKVPVLVESVGLLKIKTDTSQFVAERLGRDRFGKDVDGKKGPSTVNFTQIVINQPDGRKDANNKSDGKAIPRVVSAE